MSDSKDYVSQTLENGAIHISDEVIESIAALAIQEVDGVYGLNSNITADLGKIVKKAFNNGVHLMISENDEISIDCYIVVLYGYSVIEVAKAVQEAVASAVESTTGRDVHDVNVNISGISLPRGSKK